MINSGIDILMITFNRPEYTRLSLKRLLATCDESMRVWVWQNGNDDKVLEVVQSFTNHPRFFKYHHNVENKKLCEPMNWFWSQAEGSLLGKVDDDSLVPYGWIEKLWKVHSDVPELGIVACWHFQKEDFRYDLANKKIREFRGGHRLLQNCWVQGSGVIMKRACLEKGGLLEPQQGHPSYCIKLAAKGWVNGWYYPLIYMEHMDDPRSPHSLLKNDDDFLRYTPFSAKNNNVETLADWQAQLKRSALTVQKASLNPRNYLGWRRVLRIGWRKAKRLFGKPGR